MELGEKLRQARLEAGLSQRQLCGEEITRNMLSQIEHGTARPSMNTLCYFARKLGKPVGYFLEPDAEPVPGEETHRILSLLQRAEDAIRQEKYVYGAQLLEEAESTHEALNRQRLLLRSRIPGLDVVDIVSQLPSLDEELLLRAEGAMALKQYLRCMHLLESMEDRTSARWHILRGKVHLHQKDYPAAATQFHKAESREGKTVYPLLEQCYRELGDFKQAYFYACKQK